MVDSDGKTHLDKSYCAPQKECFGGIMGAKSPYVDDMGALGNSGVLMRICISLLNCPCFVVYTINGGAQKSCAKALSLF